MDLKQKDIKFSLSTKGFNISDAQDVVTIEGYASKMYESGKQTVDLDGESISTQNFKLEAKRLLLNHSLDEPVGDIDLSHRPDGIYLKGKVYKDTMGDKDWARLKRGLFDFSVGFLAEEAEYKTIDGKETLVFTKGTVYEVSLVAIPSNKFATLDVMKSVKTEKGCIGMECSLENIKSMNPNMDCSCLDSLKEEAHTKSLQREDMKKEEIKDKIIKGLTINETMNERWNVSDDLFQMFSYFVSTVEDNIYELKWEDKFTKEEMIANINEAMDIFKQTVQDEALRISEVLGKENQGQDTNMAVTKNVEPSENIVVVLTEEAQAEEQIVEIEETKVEVTKVEPIVESKEEIIKTEEQSEVISNEPIKDETTESTNELANTLDFKNETYNILKAELESLEVDNIRNLYDTLYVKLEEAGAIDAFNALQKIERYVEQELQTN